MFKALRHPPIARLWFGQVFSTIGDEIYRVGLTWLAVGLIGADAGYLNAGQAAALMALSFVGGKWADHWDELKTLINTDLIRAAIVLVPVVVSFFMPVPLTVLWIVALSLAGLGAFFDPALQACLPRYSPSLETLRSATGLMSLTIRMARMVGPATVGLLSGFLPMIHFFTVDAVTFIISALSVRSLSKLEASQPSEAITAPPKRASFFEAIASGFRSLKTQPGMGYVMFTKAITGGAWNLTITLGLALLIHDMTGGDTKAFGLTVACYGVGNFLGALFFGGRSRSRSYLLLCAGYLWMGVAFISLGFSPSLYWLMPVLAIAGFGGPMNELAFVDLMQRRFPVREISRIFRLRLATETSATLVCMLMAPMLFRMFSVRPVIVASGLVWLASGSIGLWRFRNSLGNK